MKHKIVIVSEEHRRRVLEIIKALPLDPKHEVSIRERQKSRSLDANALYWQWLTVIGNELGESKDELHEKFKERWLVSIYERDNPDYAEMIQALRTVWQQGLKKEAVDLRRRIVALTSTTTATVKQMSEYMDNVSRDAASLAIRLPFPDDQD